MQFIQASRDAILKPLLVVAGIVERRHTLPILANILMRKQGESVSFLATDVEIQVQTTASLAAPGENAATTVQARKLVDILKALPEGVEVTVAVSNKKATISAGKSRFALQTLSAEEFPTVALVEGYLASFSLPQKKLKQLFHAVHFAMAQQDIRYYLNGLLLVTEGHTVKVVATDGHRLAYSEAEFEDKSTQPLPRHDVILPRKTVLELQRLLGDTDEPVQIDIAANQVRLRFGEVEMVSKLVEGKFPDYQRVIPSGYKRHMTVSRETLADSLHRASILTTDKFKGVRLTLSAGVLKIQTHNAEQEEAVEEIEVDYVDGLAAGGESKPLEIGFNVGYLLDVLANQKVDQIQIDFGDANSSALITVPGDTSFCYVVMPMRI